MCIRDRHKRILENYSVIVEDGKIAEVSENPDLSAVTDVIDLDGKYLSPGLFNCHVHVGMEPVANPADFAHESIVTYTLTGVKHLEDFINTGVTFVRDVGTKHKVAIELMHAVEAVSYTHLVKPLYNYRAMERKEKR